MRLIPKIGHIFFVMDFLILLQSIKNELSELKIIKYNHEISVINLLTQAT